jgi:hypothetical protein
MTTPSDLERAARELAEPLQDRIANEACGWCFYGIGGNCTCPTRDDQIDWIRDAILTGMRKAIEVAVETIVDLSWENGERRKPRTMHAMLSECRLQILALLPKETP